MNRNLNFVKQDLITGVGSLPHLDPQQAVEFSCRFGIPFLPELPTMSIWEKMLLQSISEPLGICWKPFLNSLQKIKPPCAKIQLVGPLTSSIEIQNGFHQDLTEELSSWILEKALKMVGKLFTFNISPLIFFDEPGLCIFSHHSPSSFHLKGLQKLQFMIHRLKQEGAWVGLHCCGQTDWKVIFDLGFDVLSLDSRLSLGTVIQLDQGRKLSQFIEAGGRLALGVIPTEDALHFKPVKPNQAFEPNLLQGLGPNVAKKALNEAIWTPACGLAGFTVEQTELVFRNLLEIYEKFHLQ